jgi:hypothetical protein
MTRPVILFLCAAFLSCDLSWSAYDPLAIEEPAYCREDVHCRSGRCDAASGRCVGCLTDVDCGSDARLCVEQTCVWRAGACGSDLDCGMVPGKSRCNVDSSACVACVEDADCGGRACIGNSCVLPSTCTPVAAPTAGVVSVENFRIQAREVASRDYEACVAAGCCSARPSDPQCSSADDTRPANCVSHRDAVQYCAYLGGFVGSSALWTHAAGGEADGRFPWGAAEPSCDVAIIADATGRPCLSARLCSSDAECSPGSCDTVRGRCIVAPAASCSKTGNVADGTLCDLGGNLWEWTSEPGTGGTRVLRGGSFTTQNPEALRNSFHSYAVKPGERLIDAGIRCFW